VDTLASRCRTLNQRPARPGPVVYWMSRDQRLDHNWAFEAAYRRATRDNTPLAIVFCLSTVFPDATARSMDFMLRGLQEVEGLARERNIPFFLLEGEDIPHTLTTWLEKQGVGCVITDWSPSALSTQWRSEVAQHFSGPLYEVDAHNCIPAWIASPKAEVGARTLRPKIQRLIPDYLMEELPIAKQQGTWPTEIPTIDWDGTISRHTTNTSIPPVTWCKPGTAAGHQALEDFLDDRLPRYAAERNNPNADAQSNLSPWLHFGHISAQYVAQRAEILRTQHSEAVTVFLEELIVRRELSDNFCLYNPQYQSFSSFPRWAQESLNAHRDDPRDAVYTYEEFSQAKTHEALWNAAQQELLQTGKMHGYMRMYWAKKILEWTPNPEEALRITTKLNDTYSLDGRDPNGWTGIAWSIGGVHDRPWFERPVFGVIRYMNAAGCARKFDVQSYIAKWS